MKYGTMKTLTKALAAVLAAMALFTGACFAAEENEGGTLVVCFSCTGNTEQLARYAAEALDTELFMIEAAQPYTEADLAYYTGGRCDREQDDADIRPEIANAVEDMSRYDTVVLGYPIWHGQAPRIISTFLESYDFAGKTIVPFCTSMSSGIGSSDTDLHGLCPDTVNWMPGRRFAAETDAAAVEAWLTELGIR